MGIDNTGQEFMEKIMGVLNPMNLSGLELLRAYFEATEVGRLAAQANPNRKIYAALRPSREEILQQLRVAISEDIRQHKDYESGLPLYVFICKCKLACVAQELIQSGEMSQSAAYQLVRAI